MIMKGINLGEFEELVLLTVGALYERAYGVSVMDEIKMTWRDLFNNELRDIKPPNYAKNEASTINSIILKVLTFMGITAGIMSMIGFYSLVSLNLFDRMKEIGVRRVLGSSTISVIKVINRDYILILLFGIISGSLISHYFIPL